MALVGLLVTLLVAALLIGRFTAGPAPQPSGKAGDSPAAAQPTTSASPALNPGATLGSVRQAADASAAAEQQRSVEALKALQ
jgi:hypothetical protein